MEYIGDRIDIVQYNEKYREQLEVFELAERQQIYSSLPKQVLDEGLMDHDRRPCVVLNKDGSVVGFFVLHQYYQHEGYDTPINSVYVRSLSINETYQGSGYGTEIMMNLPFFVQKVFPEFDHLYLVVDAENQAAWNLYERAGFLHLATNPEGPIGKERLYYLDLTGNYVSTLKLVKDGNRINLLKDGEDAGFIEMQVDGDTAEIVNLNIQEQVVVEGALRQLATFIRKHEQEVNKIIVTTDNKEEYLKANFVSMDADDSTLTKLIKY